MLLTLAEDAYKLQVVRISEGIQCSAYSKIDEAVDLGDQPYELKTEQKAVRRPKPVKKALSKKDRLKRK